MMFSCPKNWPIFFVSLSIFLVIGTRVPAQANQVNGLVNQICSRTRNPSLCYQNIGKLGNESLPELCRAAITPARLLTELAVDQAHELILERKFPALNDKFVSCIDSYKQTNLDLLAVLRDLNAGKYGSLEDDAYVAFTEAGDCDRQFQPPSSEPAQLKKGTQDLLDGCNIVFVISQFLARG